MTLLGLMQVAFGADTKALEKALGGLKRGLKDTEDQIDKLGSGGGLKSFGTAVAAGIGVATTGMLAFTAGVIKLGQRGSDVDDVRNAFDRLTGSIGVEGPKALAAMRTGVKGTISDFDLMKQVNVGLSAGLKLTESQFTLVGAASRVLANQMGGDTKSAFEIVTNALATGKAAALSSIGVMVEQKGALAGLQAALGAEGDAMTTSTQKMATRQAVLESLSKIVKNAGQDDLDFADRIDILKASWSNFMDELSAAIATSPVIQAALADISDALLSAFGADQQTRVQQITTYVEDAAISIASLGQAAVFVGKYAGQAFYGLRAVLFSFLAGIVDAATGVAKLELNIIELSKHVPGMGAGAEAAAAQLRAQIVEQEAWSKSFVETGGEALNAMDAWGAAGDKTLGVLGKIKGDMEAASQKTASHASIVKALTGAEQDLGAGLAMTAKALADEQAALAKVNAEVAVALAHSPLAAVVKAFGEEAAKAAAAADLFGTRVPADIRAVADAWNASQITDLMSELSAKWIAETAKLDAEAFKKLEAMTKHAADAMIDTLNVDDVLAPFVNDFIKETDKLNAAVSDKLDGATKVYVDNVLHALEAGQRLEQQLGQLAQAFSQLAQIAGGSFGGVAQALGEMIGTMNAGSQAGTTIKSSFDEISTASKLMHGGLLSSKDGMKIVGSAAVGMGAGVIGAAGAMISATGHASKMQNVMGGVATGMKTGMAIAGPWGAAFGAAIGFVVGMLRGKKLRDIMRRAGEDWGFAAGKGMSEGLAKQIQQTGKDLHLGIVESMLVNMHAIIEEAGGVNALNFDQLIGHLHDVFSAIETGSLTSAQGLQIVEENFGSFAEAVVASGKVASKAFTDLIALNQRFGLDSKAIGAFVSGELDKIAGGVTGILAPITKGFDGLAVKIADTKKKIAELDAAGGTGHEKERAALMKELTQLETQASAGAIKYGSDLANAGTLIMGAFNAGSAAGQGWLSLMTQLGPAIDTLTLAQTNLGITGTNAALTELQATRSRVMANQELVGTVDSLNQTMLSLSNIGGLNAETFAALEAQGVTTFDRLRAAGFSEQQSLTMMAPLLGNIRDAHTRLGLPIDANTQKLIDNAEATGALEKAGMSTNDVLMSGFAALIEAVGGRLPEAFERFRSSAVSDTADVAAGVDTITYGSSPGGIKQIAIELALARQAFETFKSTATGTSGDVLTAVTGIGGGVTDVQTKLGTLVTKLGDSKSDWVSWGNKGVEQAHRVKEAVDTVSFGSSPGGIKEIPIQLAKAMQAGDAFAQHFSGAILGVKIEIDGVTAAQIRLAESLYKAGEGLDAIRKKVGLSTDKWEELRDVYKEAAKAQSEATPTAGTSTAGTDRANAAKTLAATLKQVTRDITLMGLEGLDKTLQQLAFQQADALDAVKDLAPLLGKAINPALAAIAKKFTLLRLQAIADATGAGGGSAINPGHGPLAMLKPFQAIVDNTGYLVSGFNQLMGGGLPVRALGAGGVVRRPTLAMVGESGAEAVMPLHQYDHEGGGSGVVVMPGAVVFNNPLMRDRAEADRLVEQMSTRLMAKVRTQKRLSRG